MSLRVRERTPPGSGAISVLAVSGPGAIEAVRVLSPGASLPLGRPSLLRLREGGEELDEAIVCALSPDEVEIHLHGSPPLVRRVIACLGAERAAAEATGSIEELAGALLADAPGESAARILLEQAEGALARGLGALAALDDAGRARAIDELLERARVARWALRPATVVIAGRANAGKSTLFNALLGERRAIVDAEPGTTRDLNRARARLGAWPVELVDTAGDRDLDAREESTQASIERSGQARALAARRAADLVLWLVPLDQPTLAREPSAREILVRTFADRADPATLPADAVSALEAPLAARAIVARACRGALALPDDPWKPGAAGPFTAELAREIERLRRVPRSAISRAIEELLRAPRALPGSGCGRASDPVACLPGIA